MSINFAAESFLERRARRSGERSVPRAPRRRLHRAFTDPPALPSAFPRAPAPRTALLVNPFYAKDPSASLGKHALTPTLALTTVAAATPAGWSVRLWDENLLQGPPPHEPLPEVVGITVHLTFAERAYELARWYRAQGARVVLGGLHVLSCPAEARPHADALAIGDGVATWPTILADVEKGALRGEYAAQFDGPYRDEPAPRRDLLARSSYLTTTSLIATRGCHNRCGFCYLSTAGLHMPYRMRDAEQVVAEIRADGQPYCVFLDNNLGSKPDYLRALCHALAPLGIIWSAAVTIDVTDDPSLVRDMALAGCTGVFVGLETLGEQNLVAARKKSPKPADYARRVTVLHDSGIQVNGSFVVGFDHDGPGVFDELTAWIEEVRLECATFHVLTPYPGTPLYRQMEAEGRLLHRDWSKYDTAHCVFQPRHMSPEELEAGYAGLYERTFTYRSIWRRRPAGFTAALGYLASSVLYKRSNSLWRQLIERRLVAAAWRPMVELSRRRHVAFRRALATRAGVEASSDPPTVLRGA